MSGTDKETIDESEPATESEDSAEVATDSEETSSETLNESESSDSAEESESSDAGEDESDAPDEAPDEAVEDGLIRCRYYGMTDVGLIREHNEDNLVMVDLEAEVRDLPEETTRETVVGERGLVLAVCDGMGGAAAGEVASQMAVDTVHEVTQAANPNGDRDYFAHRLVFSIEEAGARIFAAAKMDRTRRGMGTTSTVAGLIDKVLFVGQVGDSRCYVLREGKMTLITKDQSLVNQLIEAGQLTEEEAEAFEHSNIILQALGTTEEVTVDLTFHELRRGDRIMLCSDGLSGLVHAEMMQEVLGESDDLVAISKRLIEMANAGGGHDNITCIVADFDGDGLAAPGGAQPSYAQYPLPPMDHEPQLPQREPTIKTGIRKPGSDVKRPVVDFDAADPAGVDGGMGWWPLLVLLLLVAIVGFIVMNMGQTDEGDSRVTPPSIAPSAPREPVVAPVDVQVRTDIAGAELFIDGRSRGPLDESGAVTVELAPGAYRFEARVGGSAVATSTTTVGENGTADVELMLPSGTVGVEPDVEVEQELTTQQLVAPGSETPMTEDPVDPVDPSPMTSTLTPMTAPMADAPTMTAMTSMVTPAPMTTTRMTTQPSGIPNNPF